VLSLSFDGDFVRKLGQRIPGSPATADRNGGRETLTAFFSGDSKLITRPRFITSSRPCSSPTAANWSLALCTTPRRHFFQLRGRRGDIVHDKRDLAGVEDVRAAELALAAFLRSWRAMYSTTLPAGSKKKME